MDNGIASTSRMMNIWWRQTHRHEIFYVAEHAMTCIEADGIQRAAEATEDLLAMIDPNYREYLQDIWCISHWE